eukprot:Hpha_TRINITY_DN15121_c1_g5::TRINITY_DN15121_c1_g5_i1::g.126563::m.126563
MGCGTSTGCGSSSRRVNTALFSSDIVGSPKAPCANSRESRDTSSSSSEWEECEEDEDGQTDEDETPVDETEGAAEETEEAADEAAEESPVKESPRISLNSGKDASRDDAASRPIVPVLSSRENSSSAEGSSSAQQDVNFPVPNPPVKMITVNIEEAPPTTVTLPQFAMSPTASSGPVTCKTENSYAFMLVKTPLRSERSEAGRNLGEITEAEEALANLGQSGNTAPKWWKSKRDSESTGGYSAVGALKTPHSETAVSVSGWSGQAPARRHNCRDLSEQGLAKLARGSSGYAPPQNAAEYAESSQTPSAVSAGIGSLSQTSVSLSGPRRGRFSSTLGERLHPGQTPKEESANFSGWSGSPAPALPAFGGKGYSLSASALGFPKGSGSGQPALNAAERAESSGNMSAPSALSVAPSALAALTAPSASISVCKEVSGRGGGSIGSPKLVISLRNINRKFPSSGHGQANAAECASPVPLSTNGSSKKGCVWSPSSTPGAMTPGTMTSPFPRAQGSTSSWTAVPAGRNSTSQHPEGGAGRFRWSTSAGEAELKAEPMKVMRPSSTTASNRPADQRSSASEGRKLSQDSKSTHPSTPSYRFSAAELRESMCQRSPAIEQAISFPDPNEPRKSLPQAQSTFFPSDPTEPMGRAGQEVQKLEKSDSNGSWL